MALSRQFDGLFARYGGRIPVAYMRALSKRESNQDPSDTDGPAWGLMQVVEVVRNSWNKRNPREQYTRGDLLNPEVNVKMAASLLNRIVKAYGKHPDPNMKEDWTNPEFVNLVTAGWNSGYSEAAGVGFVARYLEERGIPVTHDNVFRYAAAAGGTRHLQNPAKQRWQKTVTNLYFQQPDAGRVGGQLVGFALAALVAWGVYKLLS